MKHGGSPMLLRFSSRLCEKSDRADSRVASDAVEVGMMYIAGHDRSQLLLLPEAADDYVGPDNLRPVRRIASSCGGHRGWGPSPENGQGALDPATALLQQRPVHPQRH